MKKVVSCLFIGSLMALSGVHGSQEDWSQEIEKLQNLGEALGFSNKTSHAEEHCYNSNKNQFQTLCHLTRGLLEVLFLERAWDSLDLFTNGFKRAFEAGQQILALADGTLNRCCSSLRGSIDLDGKNTEMLEQALKEMTHFVQKALEKFENYEQQLHGEFCFQVPSKEYEVAGKVWSLLGSIESGLLWSVQKIDETFQRLQNGQEINGKALQQEVHQILKRYSIKNL